MVDENNNPLEQVITLDRARLSPRAEARPLVSPVVNTVPQTIGGMGWRDFTVITAAIIFTAVVGILYLMQASEITKLAYRCNELRQSIFRLQEENSVIRYEIMQDERLDRIEARATAIGLGKAEQVQYLQLPEMKAEATPSVTITPEKAGAK